jgi:maltooligosyltrehalose trehalohydrolase
MACVSTRRTRYRTRVRATSSRSSRQRFVVGPAVRWCSSRRIIGILRSSSNPPRKAAGDWTVSGPTTFTTRCVCTSRTTNEGYYEDFSGRVEDLATTIRQGWFFTGQRSKHMKENRGTDPGTLAPRQFVVCIQNHDQIGNRAEGHRLSHDVDLPTYRAVSALLLTLPETPLLFMGQEWAATSPFLFFTDHNEELGRQVTKGRREEFASFASFADPALRERIPDPQAEATFEQSRLDWGELDASAHASTLRLYQRLLGLRATSAPLRNGSREGFDARSLDAETLLIERREGNDRLWIVVRLGGAGTVTVRGTRAPHVMLTTEDPDLAPDVQPIDVVIQESAVEVRFSRPGAVLVRGSGFAT